MGTFFVGIRSCLPPAFPPFWSRLIGKALLAQGYSLWNHTKWFPIMGERRGRRKSRNICIGLIGMTMEVIDCGR